MQTLGRPRVEEPAAGAASRSRPVLLATLEVPFDPAAVEFAVDTAVECGQPLLVANAVELTLGPLCTGLRYGALEPPEEDAASIRAPAEIAFSLGVPVERLRVCSPHPVDALLELAAERRPGVLVFGPDRDRLSARAYRRAVRKLGERAACLVWVSDPAAS